MADVPSMENLEERLLVDRLNRIAQNRHGYYCVHLHLSNLRPTYRKLHFIRLAARSFDFLIGQYEATLFTLSNSDLVLVCLNVPIGDAEAPVEKVRGLFNDDPLAEIDQSGLEEDHLSTWYDLSNRDDFNTFRHLARKLLAEAEERAVKAAKTAEEMRASTGTPLTARMLNKLMRIAQQVDVEDLVREQLCLKLGIDGAESLVFQERFVSIRDFQAKLAAAAQVLAANGESGVIDPKDISAINLFSSPWLFQYLTETLDRMVLAMMSGLDFSDLADPISLNLNVSTILSRDFQLFHRAVDGQTDKIVVEFQVIDIFADMESFKIARDMLQQNGYRVLVDGLTPVSIQFFAPAQLKADFVKIGWGKEFEEEDDESRLEDLKQTLREAGRESIILARVDSEKAIRWGLNLGIVNFQGYLMDQLVEDTKHKILSSGSALKKRASQRSGPGARVFARPV